ncbi:IS1634 family transposase [soil metagenome]
MARGLPLSVFIRKKRNKSGSVSFHIVRKQNGKQILVKSLGTSKNKYDLESLALTARHELELLQKQNHLELDYDQDKLFVENILNNIHQIEVSGVELILGKMFDEIGFNALKNPLFRHLVLSRICYPGSKLKTVEYLLRHHQITYEIDAVYRYLDKLSNIHKEQIQDISYHHTLGIFNGKISILFYDVTTLYFEAANEDDLRKTGFSKDGKAQHPQIVLGLLVSEQGYPLAFEMFEGNTFEGKTMLPVIDRFKQKYKLQNIIVVADAGLLSNKNIELLQKQQEQFILGARIKNESRALQKQITQANWINGQTRCYAKFEEVKLIVSYADARYEKDKHNREKGLKRLEKLIRTGKLTKQQINNRGYNKYLKLEGEVKINIDYDKFKADNRWDGLKGYLTNANLSDDKIINHYKQLWHIEKAFRISKTDLKIRPIYHRLAHRIQAHLIVAFCSYKIYKELERQLKIKQSSLSTGKAIEIMQSIYTLAITLPTSQKQLKLIWAKTEEQKYLLGLFNVKF